MAAELASEALSEEFYKNIMDKENITKDWILLSTPYPVITILLVYLLFVLKIGPWFMLSRNPYELRTPMRLYNLFQVFFNAFLLYSCIGNKEIIPYTIKFSCSLEGHEEVDHLKHIFLFYSWNYLVSKLLDLVDTVFMVLRKKDSHITFLHVYHHIAMVAFVWITLVYIKSHHGVIPGFINVLVHTIMYSYYFLATFPHLKRYLWWKKHLTKLQLGQFGVILIYISLLYYHGCTISRVFTYIWVFNVFFILVLFINFYIKAYIVKTSPSSDLKSHAKSS